MRRYDAQHVRVDSRMMLAHEWALTDDVEDASERTDPGRGARVAHLPVRRLPGASRGIVQRLAGSGAATSGFARWPGANRPLGGVLYPRGPRVINSCGGDVCAGSTIAAGVARA